jgi:hypothetical protein
LLATIALMPVALNPVAVEAQGKGNGNGNGNKNSNSAGGLGLPVSGSVDGVANAVSGTLEITRFVSRGGTLTAVGALTAVVKDAATGAITRTIVAPQISVPVGVPQESAPIGVQQVGSCDILHLTLGPLDLNLLGLVVHLDVVNLYVEGQQGPGNLVGNLLCAITGLLNNPGAQLAQIVNALNQLLAALTPP